MLKKKVRVINRLRFVLYTAKEARIFQKFWIFIFILFPPYGGFEKYSQATIEYFWTLSINIHHLCLADITFHKKGNGDSYIKGSLSPFPACAQWDERVPDTEVSLNRRVFPSWLQLAYLMSCPEAPVALLDDSRSRGLSGTFFKNLFTFWFGKKVGHLVNLHLPVTDICRSWKFE